MIGILCATSEELQALRAVFSLDEIVQHGGYVFETSNNIVLAQTGIGKVNAAAVATMLCARFECQQTIFAGVAGGLNPLLPVGSVIFGQRLGIIDYGIYRDGALTPTQSGSMPTKAEPYDTIRRVPEKVERVLDTLRTLVQPAINAPVVLGTILTADYFLNCAQTRDQHVARFAGDAIDMESGAVAQVTTSFDVPLFVIRTVSDGAGETSHLIYSEMVAMAAHNSALCVAELVPLL